MDKSKAKKGAVGGVFDLRRSINLDSIHAGQDDLAGSDARHMRLRNLAASKQDQKNKFTSAGVPSKNFGKQFSYISTCFPGGTAAAIVNKNES